MLADRDSERRRGSAPGAGAENFLLPVANTMVTEVVRLQPMEAHHGADIHPAARRVSPHQSRWMCLKEAVTLWRDHTGAGFWQNPRSCGEEPTLEQVFWQDLCPTEDPHWNSLFLKEFTPWE